LELNERAIDVLAVTNATVVPHGLTVSLLGAGLGWGRGWLCLDPRGEQARTGRVVKDPSAHVPLRDFRVLFESVPGLYMVLRRDLTIAAASDAFLRATMTKREEILGRGVFDVFPANPHDPGASGVSNLATASFERVLRQGVSDAMAVQKYDIQRPESEGGGFEERYWSPINSPVFGKGEEVVYIIQRVEDVTEFLRLQQREREREDVTTALRTRAESLATEIYLRAQQLQVANEHLRTANRFKGEFLANMSHELRTPLNSIIGFAELLHDGKVGPVSPDQEEFLGDILASGRHLLQLINDVLDLSKVEAGKLQFNPEAVSLSLLIGEALGTLRATAATKAIQIECSVDAGLGEVLLDASRLKQVLYNYVSNALKFTPKGGRVVVRVLPEAAPWAFRLEVEDTGPGIPPDDSARLFKEFEQLDSGTATKHQGTGLGLMLTKRLVEAQGGNVGLLSTVGRGSTFYAIYPRPAVAGAAVKP
jgi:signal transduction histidine kinase